MIISSIHNNKVKRARRLLDRRERQQRGELLLEGHRFVSEALEAGASIGNCFFVSRSQTSEEQRLLLQLEHEGVELISVTDEVLRTIADTTTPQGLVAVAKAPLNAGAGMLVGNDLVLIADEIRDPGNLGTMLRTAAAIGAGVILTSGCTDPTGPKVVRGSAGALYSVPLWNNAEPSGVMEEVERTGHRLVVCDASGEKPYYALDWRGRVAVVIGNEAHGPNPAWRGGASIVCIPMPGRVESLNAGVAAAVVLYEALRQRQ